MKKKGSWMDPSNIQARYRRSGDGFRSGSGHRNFHRGGGGFVRPRTKQYPAQHQQQPSRKADILMEAGKLAAEYLVSKGMLPPNSLHGKGPEGRASAYGDGGHRKRRYADGGDDDGEYHGKGLRRGRRRNGPYGRGYGLEWSGRENGSRGPWMDRGRRYPDNMDGGDEEDDDAAPGFGRVRRGGFGETGSSISRVSSDERHSRSDATGESCPEVGTHEMADDTGSKLSGSSSMKDPLHEADLDENRGTSEVKDVKVSISEAGDEVKSDEGELKKTMQEDEGELQPCEVEVDPANQQHNQSELCSSVEAPAKPQLSAAQQSPTSAIMVGEVNVGESTNGSLNQTSTLECLAADVSIILSEQLIEESLDPQDESGEVEHESGEVPDESPAIPPGFGGSRAIVHPIEKTGFSQHVEKAEEIEMHEGSSPPFPDESAAIPPVFGASRAIVHPIEKIGFSRHVEKAEEIEMHEGSSPPNILPGASRVISDPSEETSFSQRVDKMEGIEMHRGSSPIDIPPATVDPSEETGITEHADKTYRIEMDSGLSTPNIPSCLGASIVIVDLSEETSISQHIEKTEGIEIPRCSSLPNVSQESERSLPNSAAENSSPDIQRVFADEVMVEADDHQKSVDIDATLFPKAEYEPNATLEEPEQESILKLEEDKDLQPTYFDLNLTGSPELTDIPDEPLPGYMQTSAFKRESGKEVLVDVALSICNNRGTDNCSQLSGDDKVVLSGDDKAVLLGDDKVIPVINLEDDSPTEDEDSACDSSKLKNETIYPNLANFLSQTAQTDLPGIQDGYSLTFSDFLGTDISGCSSVPADLNNLQTTMGLHEEEVVPGVDDSLYESFGEIPISFMDVWDEPPQDYGKFF